jgi:hypothetical protein
MKKISLIFIICFFGADSFSQSSRRDQDDIIDYIAAVTKKSVVVVSMSANRDSVKIIQLITTSFVAEKNKWVTDTLNNPIQIKKMYPNLELIIKSPPTMIKSFDRMEN